MKRFNRQWLMDHPGAILHARSKRFYGRLIRAVVRSWGNHDALIVNELGRLGVGDSIFPIARVTTLEEWERRMNSGEDEVRVYLPSDYDKTLGEWVSAYWLQFIRNTPYDWFGIVQLPYKLTLQWIAEKTGWKWAIKQAGFEWSRWCTEGSGEAYAKNAYKPMDLWKRNPTPRTTENRLADGTLKDCTDEAINTLFDQQLNPATGAHMRMPILTP